MSIREAAERLPGMLDTAAHWIEACPFENALPHSVALRREAELLRAALSEPDPMTEACEIIREVVGAGVSFEDVRVKYKEVQLSRALLDEARDFLKRMEGRT